MLLAHPPASPFWVPPGRSARARPVTLAKGKGRPSRMEYISVEADGSDAWRASSALEALQRGGCGVIPTDTSYSFVTTVSSKKGVEEDLMATVKAMNIGDSIELESVSHGSSVRQRQP